jgi:membrane-associated phospholipid phosphatase
MKYGDETLDLSGRDVTLARAISRITPAPIINLVVGTIMSISSSDRLGPILTPSTSILLCLIFMVVLPVAPILVEAYRGKVDLDVSRQEVRTKFFAYAIFFYLIAFSSYYLADAQVMINLSAAYITVTTGVMLVNRISKVSVHGAGVGGPGTALMVEYGFLAAPIIPVWILVVWSRTVLKQHTLTQSLSGVLLASVITLLTYYTLFMLG